MTKFLEKPRGPSIQVNSWGAPTVRQQYGPRVRLIVAQQVGYVRRTSYWLFPHVHQHVRRPLRAEIREGVCVPLWMELQRQVWVPDWANVNVDAWLRASPFIR